MDITYNGIGSPNNLLTLSDVPNILKVSEDVTGTKATISFYFEGNIRQTVTADSQYYVTVLGETVTNVMNAELSNNKRFFISDDEDSTAMNFAMALRNCSSIAADFIVRANGPDVDLVAKTFGSKGLNSNSVVTNLPNANFTVELYNGQSYSDLFNSKITVDVYSGSSTDVANYITTLEKYYYGNECAFNMSPLLSTISEYGKTIPYSMVLNLITSGGEWRPLGSQSGMTTCGYYCNGSDNFKYAQGAQMLLNDTIDNKKMILYTYGDTIPYSVLCGLDTGGYTITLSLKDSAYNEIYTYSTTGRRTSSNCIIDSYVNIPSQFYTSTYYADITVGNLTYRFNVIKPLKATEYYQRVYWRNEYGGISFFDFTGQRQTSDSLNISTYEKNVFDYYDTYSFEKKRIYKNDDEKTVKLTSHLMEENGKYIFNSLAKSKKVWTDVGGNTYYIIPKSIEVNEDQNYNGIFTASLTYTYSYN